MPELIGQTFPIVMRISLLIKTVQADHSIRMHVVDEFLSENLKKYAYFIFKMVYGQVA